MLLAMKSLLAWRGLLPVMCASLLAGVVSVTQPSAAQSSPWTVLPMSAEGMDPGVAQTFRDLLEAELAAGTGVQFVPGPFACRDVPCAQQAGYQSGAQTVILGLLRPLGAKTLASVTMVDTASGRVLSSHNMSTERVEELDLVAQRLAASLLSGKAPSDTATVGTVTEKEEQPERRRGVQTNFLMRIGGITPVSSNSYGELGTGVAFDTGMWIETRHLAIEPRIGARFDVSGGERGSYFELPIDLGAYYIFDTGDVAPLLGGGMGMHYLSDTRYHDVQLGQTLVATHRGEDEDSAWGLAAHARAGLLFLRTYRVHLALTADYNVVFTELNQGSTPQSLVFGLGLLL